MERAGRGQALSTSPTERLRQMTAAAGKKESVSLSIFMEVNDLEVAEEFSATATLYFWAKGVWMARWGRGQHKAWRKQIFEVRTWRQVRGPAGVVMCEARDFGVPLRQWHTLLFGRQVALDMGVVCPQDVKKWAAKHDCEELKGRVVLRRKANELWTDQERKVMRKLVVQGGWMQKRLCDTGWLDEMKCRGCIKGRRHGETQAIPQSILERSETSSVGRMGTKATASKEDWTWQASRRIVWRLM